MLPVIELFTSIQGEGKYTGVPSHFLRVGGCNLRCVFKDSICDTAYSSFHPEKSLFADMDDLLKAFWNQCKKYPRVKHLVITGGEPLLYRNALEKFLIKIQEKQNFVVTIETNGTLKMINPLSKARVDLYSVSPKLSTAVAKAPCKINDIEIDQEMINTQNASRINIDNLINFALYANDYQFKFVYSGMDSVKEIDDIYNSMGEKVEKMDCLERGAYYQKHPNHHTMLMPEGITNDQLSTHREEIASLCVSRGWQMTDREHIIIWGDKRGV